MIFPLLMVPIITFCLINFIRFIYKSKNLHKIKILGTTLIHLLKIIVLLSLVVNCFYSIYLWKYFPKVDIENDIFLYPNSFGLFELQHNLNLPFIILSFLILIIALLSIWYLNINILFILNIYIFLEICLVGAFSCVSLFIFLLFFEASAIPIFLLIVYCGSTRRERLKASYYFLFFTLYGSLSLLLMLISTYSVQQIEIFTKDFFYNDSLTIWILAIISFAVKIPLFPVHIWLPYAHVEASTAASILLAAIMLKLGGYGVLKYMLTFFSIQIHLYFQSFILLIAVVGIIYGGLAALRQLDLKRQIAFSSISHMSFAIFGIFTFSEVGIKGAIYLMLSHGLTSAALFYLIGILSERYHTRSIMAFGGLLGVMPIFAVFLIISSIANIGFPGTSGFLPEFLILLALFNNNIISFLPILLGMFLTTSGALILLLRVLYGHIKILYIKSSFSDVAQIDFFVLSFLFFWILLFGLFDVLLLDIWNLYIAKII